MNESPSFDDQAGVFEARAGLTAAIGKQIASAVLAYGGVRPGELVVEMGAGTGEIGQWLAKAGVAYVGIDSSAGMLEEFLPRLPKDSSARLVHGDANECWPIDDRVAKVIFGSRVFHLLDVAHAIAEAKRIAHPDGGVLISGRVERSRTSVRSLVRERMRQLLEQHGHAPRPTEKHRQDVLDQAVALGGSMLERHVAAAWRVTARPADSIKGWQQKSTLGGVTPPSAVKEAILRELTEWASETFGDPDAETMAEEFYILEGVRFSA